MSTNIWLKPSPTGPSKPIKGVRKRPAYKEVLKNLSTRSKRQVSASSLESEGPYLGSEARHASSEECTHDSAADLIRVVEESGINLDRLRLEDIQPGILSDWVREAVDSNYEAWLPVHTEVGQNQRARAPLRMPEGPCAKRRAQYARVQRHYNMDRTRCSQEVITGTSREPPASLPLSLQEPFWHDLY